MDYRGIDSNGMGYPVAINEILIPDTHIEIIKKIKDLAKANFIQSCLSFQLTSDPLTIQGRNYISKHFNDIQKYLKWIDKNSF
jgi:hypothetical protein